jgi:hypothetical protein
VAGLSKQDDPDSAAEANADERHGVSEAVAKTIVNLGVDWSGIETIRGEDALSSGGKLCTLSNRTLTTLAP